MARCEYTVYLSLIYIHINGLLTYKQRKIKNFRCLAVNASARQATDAAMHYQYSTVKTAIKSLLGYAICI